MRDLLPMMIVFVLAMTAFTLLWRQGAFLRLSGYFRETQEELKKCTWPTWDELTGSTVVVIVSVALLGGFTIGVDLLFAYTLQLIV
jgi:preprotein translocase subunit SecE